MIDVAPPTLVVITTPAQQAKQSPDRQPLPPRRRSYTRKFKVASHSLFLTCGLYADGRLGEIFLDTHKYGSAFREWMVETARAFSTSLQFGLPLDALVKLYKGSPGDPRGRVDGHPTIVTCTSVMDLVARVVEEDFLREGGHA